MLIDITMPVVPGAVFRRGAPPVKIETRRLYHEREGEFKSIILSFPAHTATHIDLAATDRSVPPERMIGRGRLIDVSELGDTVIRLPQVEKKNQIQARDFVFFKTGWSQFAGTDRYYEHPELAHEVIQWLVSNRVNAVGIDALGLGRGPNHGKYDRLLGEHGIFVIENLTNLHSVSEREFTVFCFPLKIANVDALPCRVIVEVGSNTFQPPAYSA